MSSAIRPEDKDTAREGAVDGRVMDVSKRRLEDIEGRGRYWEPGPIESFL